MIELAAAVLASSVLLTLAIGYLAHSVSRTLSITVQAPTALMPPEVADLLRRLDDKLTPTLSPASDEQLTQLVREGVALAETSVLKGHARFRIASEFVSSRAAAQKLALDPRDCALRIEAEVVARSGATDVR